MRTIHLVWLAPEGAEPDYYSLIFRFDFPEGYKTGYSVLGTEWTCNDWPSKYTAEVRAVYPDGSVSEPCTLYRSFAITDIEIRDNGVIVTFATEPGRHYTLQKSVNTNEPVYTDVTTLVATSDELKIGGDVSDPSARYRVLEEI